PIAAHPHTIGGPDIDVGRGVRIDGNQILIGRRDVILPCGSGDGMKRLASINGYGEIGIGEGIAMGRIRWVYGDGSALGQSAGWACPGIATISRKKGAEVLRRSQNRLAADGNAVQNVGGYDAGKVAPGNTAITGPVQALVASNDHGGRRRKKEDF